MRLPTGGFDDMAQGAVQSSEQPYTIYRRQDDNDSTYGPDEGEYTALNSTRPLHVYGEDERVEVATAGEIVEASASGYARPSVDIQEDDRLDFGGSRYEVEQRTPVYDGNGTTMFYQLRLRRL